MKKMFVLCLSLFVLCFFSNVSFSAEKRKTPKKKEVKAKATSISAEKQPSDEKKQPLIAREIKLDRNYDGKIDRLEVYDKTGTIVRVEADTTGNGKMNEWIHFKGGIRSKAERDVNGDGKADTFLTYGKKGVIAKLEADTNGDGKVNEWVFYKDGNPIRAERDTNGDGKADTWIQY